MFKTLAHIASKKQKKCDDVNNTLEFDDESVDDEVQDSNNDGSSH